MPSWVCVFHGALISCISWPEYVESLDMNFHLGLYSRRGTLMIARIEHRRSEVDEFDHVSQYVQQTN